MSTRAPCQNLRQPCSGCPHRNAFLCRKLISAHADNRPGRRGNRIPNRPSGNLDDLPLWIALPGKLGIVRALLTTNHGPCRIRSEQEVWRGIVANVPPRVIHSCFLVRSKQDADGLSICRTVVRRKEACCPQRQNSRSLVVKHSPSHKIAFAPLQSEGIRTPSRTRRHYIQVRDCRHLAITLARNIGKADNPAAVVSLETKPRRHSQRTVEGIPRSLAPWRIGPCSGRIPNTLNADKLCDVGNNRRPVVVNKTTNALFA